MGTGLRRCIASVLATLCGASAFTVIAPVAARAAPTRWSSGSDVQVGTLAGVSCPAATFCVAAGSGPLGRTLVDVMHGSVWSVVPSPNVRQGDELSAVTCLSATRCFAVGTFDNGVHNQSLIERWDGRRWSVLRSPRPVRGDDYLSGVACATATRCVAVGVTLGGGSDLALTERWDGTRWTAVPSAPLGFGVASVLSAVTCVRVTFCVAVGTATPPTAVPQTVAERWNGSSWSLMPTPTIGNVSGRVLLGVSCASPTFCAAVGNSANARTLAELWDGTRWYVARTPNAAGGTSALAGVSCKSPTSCVAVGGAELVGVQDVFRTLVATWDGRAWEPATSPEVETSARTTLASVSCATTYECTGVGSYTVPVLTPRVLTISGRTGRQTVRVSWTRGENARLVRIARYLHQSPARVQKTAVYALAFVVALGSRTPTPVSLAPRGHAASYATVWAPSQLDALHTVGAKFNVGSLGATRIALAFLSFVLALHGH